MVSATGITCDWSTTAYSANAPVLIPWFKGSPRWLCSRFSAASANVPSHRCGDPAAQKKHRPHQRTNDTTTRSPGRTLITPGPVSVTTPAPSCPATTGGGAAHPAHCPRTRFRSLWHTPTAASRTFTSPGPGGSRSISSTTSGFPNS